MASASLPCSVRTHNDRAAPATRNLDVSDLPERSRSSEIAHEWSPVAQSQGSPLAEQMPCPYCVILTAVQLNSRNAEINPATTLVLPTLRECPPTTTSATDHSFFASRATVANCFKYSRSGCAGVPQNALPLPRKTLFGSTPPCPPSITPSPMRACSPMPTCPPSTTPFSITMLPESPVCAAITTSSPIWQLWPMWTRLSIFVPRPIRVSSSAPRSIVVLAPISTSSSITSFPTWGNFS